MYHGDIETRRGNGRMQCGKMGWVRFAFWINGAFGCKRLHLGDWGRGVNAKAPRTPREEPRGIGLSVRMGPPLDRGLMRGGDPLRGSRGAGTGILRGYSREVQFI